MSSAAQELIKACLEIFLNQEESDISKMSSMLVMKLIQRFHFICDLIIFRS